MWACDFTVAYDWLFRAWYIFVVMELQNATDSTYKSNKIPNRCMDGATTARSDAVGEGPAVSDLAIVTANMPRTFQL